MTEGVSSHLHQERDRERGCDRIGALWRHRPFAHPSPPRLFGFSPQKRPTLSQRRARTSQGSLFFSSPRARKKNARHILAETQPHRAALWTTHPLENLTIPLTNTAGAHPSKPRDAPTPHEALEEPPGTRTKHLHQRQTIQPKDRKDSQEQRPTPKQITYSSTFVARV